MRTPLLRIAAAAVAVLQFVVPAATAAWAQSFRADRAVTPAYEVTTIYDRITDSTRVAVALKGSSRPFGPRSRVWLDVSFTYPGRRLMALPETVVLTLESFTTARGGWAFAKPRDLRVRSGKGLELEIPASQYAKRKVHPYDSGRREMLSFRIPAEQFATMAAEPELEFKAAKASIRFRDRRMEMLREIVRRMTSSGTEVR